jgi:hypothetical protein
MIEQFLDWLASFEIGHADVKPALATLKAHAVVRVETDHHFTGAAFHIKPPL